MTWQDRAREQSGVVSREQLLASGLSASQVARLARARRLDALHPGTYLVGGAPRTYRARLWAAVLTTHGLLSYHTAGELWGVVETRSDLVHVVITHDRRLTAPTGVRLHRWRPRDVPATTLDGLPVTPRSWTILSMLGRMHPEEGTRLADRAVQRGWLTKLDLDERLRSHPGRHGNPRLRILAQTIGDGAAAGSERQLHRVLRTAGVVGWVPNYPVWVGGELVAVVDVALPHRRIAIELDGMAHHVDVDRFQRDRTRQNALVALGWTVLRFTWSDVAHRPGYVVSTLRGV